MTKIFFDSFSKDLRTIAITKKIKTNNMLSVSPNFSNKLYTTLVKPLSGIWSPVIITKIGIMVKIPRASEKHAKVDNKVTKIVLLK